MSDDDEVLIAGGFESGLLQFLSFSKASTASNFE